MSTPIGWVLPVYNPGDADARADIVLGNHSIDWHQLLVAQFKNQGKAMFGLTPIDRLANFVNGGFLIEATAEIGVSGLEADGDDTTVETASEGASCEVMLETTFATEESSSKRAVFNGSSALQHSLVDLPVAVFGRFQSTTIMGGYTVNLSAHHGVGSPHNFLGSVPFVLPNAENWYELFLGTTVLRASPTWDLHLGRTSGSGTLRTDLLYMVPLDAMMVVDSTSNWAVKINAHAQSRAICTLLSDPTLHDGVATTQGEVPVVPPGLSTLFIRVWRDTTPSATGASEQEELENMPKLSVLSDTLAAWVDVTPQHYQ